MSPSEFPSPPGQVSHVVTLNTGTITWYLRDDVDPVPEDFVTYHTYVYCGNEWS